ncbi:MAG: LysM peptidoglycan-binding domain-containing protein [Candidatus Levybacteria bacterium]|nr:LysM peptidoglycan-binding domain-containing protein [Candidatus Levybacteria bacterium]
MPTKKNTKKTIKSDSKESPSFDFQKLVNSSDSYKSLIYGIVTVVVLFIVIALGIRTLQQNKAQIDEQALSTQNLDQQNLTSKYTVTEGDTLWSIAEKSYNDGFRWNEIAKANNITDASTLEKGTELTIPKIATEPKISPVEKKPLVTRVPTAVPSVAPTVVMTTTGQKITGNSYKIVDGDTLWDIAIRSYGDGYRWVEVALQNNIANPDLIYAGNVLKLARP